MDSNSRGIGDVIVTLGDAPADATAGTSPRVLRIDNRGCRFEPRAGVLRIGDEIEVLNSDPTLHTVHFYGALEKNLALPARRSPLRVPVTEPGLIIVRCDVHGWMQAHLRVDRHGWHALSDAAGRFRIGGIPPGVWTLEAWHPVLGPKSLQLRVEAGGTTAVEIEYDSGNVPGR